MIRLWRAILAYTVITAIITFPLWIHPSATVLSDGADTDLFVWTLSWDTHAFTHRPWQIFDANIFAPLQHTLAFSENLIGSALLAAPIIWTTGNAVLAMNVVALLMCPACGAGAYLLARRIGIRDGGAFIAGLIFAFAAPRLLRLDQLFLATIAWMPFALAYFHSYLERGQPRDLRVAAGFCLLQVLTSGHGAVFLAVAGIVLFGPRLLAGRARARLVRMPRDLGMVGLIVTAVVVLVALPYRSVQAEMGLRRSLDDWRPLKATSFLAAPTYAQTWLLSRLAPAARINETADAYLFPGWIALALAVWSLASIEPAAPSPRQSRRWAALAVAADAAVLATLAAAVAVTISGPFRVRLSGVIVMTARQPWRAWLLALACTAGRIAIGLRVHFAPLAALRRWIGTAGVWVDTRRRDPGTAYLLLVLLCVWLALGPPFGLWPYVYWLPGFDFIRASSRFTLPGLLGVGVLAGAGFDAATRTMSRSRRFTALVVVSALMCGEYLVRLEGVPYRVDIPESDRWLAAQPTPFSVAEVPLPDLRAVGLFNKRQATYMLHSTMHWQKTVHGWSGLVPPEHLDLYEALTRFPDEESLRQLQRFKVGYVVVHTDLYAPGEWPLIEARLSAREGQLVLVHADARGRVYAFHAGILPARAAESQ
jgi:hypothetical protein